MSDSIRQCGHCKGAYYIILDICPHCGVAAVPPPNVALAVLSEESNALNTRYEDALASARTRGCEALLSQFERLADDSHAVISRSFDDVYALAKSENQTYASYYGQLQGGVRVPTGEIWDSLRSGVDDLFYETNKDKIRFAALSLDGHGIPHYGAFSILMKDSHIAHRASVFHENSVYFAERHAIPAGHRERIPKGYRAPWQEGPRLAAAKIAEKLTRATRPEELPGLLLAPRTGGPDSEDDFIEVHIWGSFSVKAFDKVLYSPVVGGKVNKTRLKSLLSSLEKHEVPLEGL